MGLPTDISIYVQWSGYLTIACLVLTIIGFILKWGVRFRLVGITSFMTVVTGSLFALGLGLFTRTEIPGAVRYALVYDNGANQAVISVPFEELTASQVDATLRQAADDLFSFGRADREKNELLTIRLRTLSHPEIGVSIPLYLGEVKRSLRIRDDEQMQVKVFSKNLAKLRQQTATNS